jgi:TonB family protein
MQAVLAGLAAFPLLGLSLGSTSPDVAYKDGSYTVTVKEHFSLMDYDPGPPNIELYRVRLGFFNEYLGHIARNQTEETVPALKAWWRAVSAVSFEADSNRGVAWHSGTAVPFEVNPPYHGGDGDKLPRAAEPAYQPTPAPPGADISEPDRVYTYVEEMPHLPGTVGLAPVVEAVEERLVVPPHTPEGRLFVELTVAETGDIQEVRILKGVNSSVDSAVLTAVRRLPRFEPGRQNGRPVKVSLTMPIPVVHKYPRQLHPHRSHAKPRPTPPPDWPDLLAPG